MKSKMRKRKLLVCLIAVFMALTACANNQAGTTPAPSGQATATAGQPTELVVSAAASLADVMTEISELYKTVAPNVTVKLNFGSSGALQEQIEQGAPADVYMSASQKSMTELEDGGFILEGSKVELLENKVVLVIPAGKDKPDSFENIGDAAKTAIGEPETVPAGEYAVDVLTYYKVLDTLEAADKLVYANDVRQVLSWVESGDADAGIVYLTDALTSDKVKVVATASDESHKAIIYPAAVVKDSKNPDAAKAFVDFLSTPEVIKLFKDSGFTTLKG